MKSVLLALALATPALAGKYDKSINLTCGAEYQQNSASFKPKALFAKWRSKAGEANPLELRAAYNVAANSGELEVKYEIAGTKMEVDVDTARSSNFFKRISLSRGLQAKGRDVQFTPEYDFGSRVASLKSRFSVSADTDIELQLESDDVVNLEALGAAVEVSHTIDGKNSGSARFNLNSGDVTYEYRRKLAEDAELVFQANPGKETTIEWEDAGSQGLWTTNVRVPWGDVDGTSLSVKRKFEF